MPKVKYLNSPVDGFRKFLKGRAYVECGGIEGMSQSAGMGRTTTFSRMRNPMDITLDELRRIRRATDTPVDELMAQLRPLL